MVGINGKTWHDLTVSDINAFIVDIDQRESFFFEFKSDEIKPNKFIREICALANTYGGYVFIGLADDKKIQGCSAWTEERINASIKNGITPIPAFDIKSFTIGGKSLLIIKVDEGSEPPYITNNGEILIRISSSSCVVKDSSVLNWLIQKNRYSLKRIEEKITIPKIQDELDIIFGYIDIGFEITISDIDMSRSLFLSADLDGIASELNKPQNTISLYRIGNEIVYSSGSVSSSNGFIPAHMHNFMVIMPDGSAKMRLLIFSNDKNSKNVNLGMLESVLSEYRKIYKGIMGNLLPDSFIYAKRYEELNVLKQFQPTVKFETQDDRYVESAQELNDRLKEARKLDESKRGVFTALTNSRIPPTGLQNVDIKQIENWGYSITCDDIIDALIHSSFMVMGMGNDQLRALEETSNKESENK